MGSSMINTHVWYSNTEINLYKIYKRTESLGNGNVCSVEVWIFFSLCLFVSLLCVCYRQAQYTLRPFVPRVYRQLQDKRFEDTTYLWIGVSRSDDWKRLNRHQTAGSVSDAQMSVRINTFSDAALLSFLEFHPTTYKRSGCSICYS